MHQVLSLTRVLNILDKFNEGASDELTRRRQKKVCPYCT